MGLNRCCLIGNLGRDPELKYTQSGTPVCKISLGCSESYKDKDGEWKSRTEWVNVVVWDKKGEALGEQCKKGDKVFVEGKIQTRSWDDKDGNKRYTTEVVAQHVEWWTAKKEASKAEAEPEKYGRPAGDDCPF